MLANPDVRIADDTAKNRSPDRWPGPRFVNKISLREHRQKAMLPEFEIRLSKFSSSHERNSGAEAKRG
jgi:hypothetical protein